MKLSIIIPSYNSAGTIRDTLHSIVNQSFDDFECWIIDGGSDDDTLTIIEEFSTRSKAIKYISGPDKGIYDAMNKGIELSSGEYLYFLGSDDLLYHKTILAELFVLPEFGTFDFIYGKVLYKHSRLPEGGEKDYFKIVRNLENIHHQAIFYKRNVFQTIGNYDLNFPIYADFNMNVKCFNEKSISKKYIDRIIAVFNEKGTSYFHRGKDSFIQDLHKYYVTTYEDPVSLYATSRFLEKRINDIMNSQDYRIGKKIGNMVRVARRLLGKKKH
jgi:glycosyltransferase involved in cell wall biosynthesis